VLLVAEDVPEYRAGCWLRKRFSGWRIVSRGVGDNGRGRGAYHFTQQNGFRRVIGIVLFAVIAGTWRWISSGCGELRGGKRKGRAYWSGGYCPVSAGNPSWRAILGGEGFETRKTRGKGREIGNLQE
jgi:hypothetical protein